MLRQLRRIAPLMYLAGEDGAVSSKKSSDPQVDDLQTRLRYINSLLIEALGVGSWRDKAARNTLKAAISEMRSLFRDMDLDSEPSRKQQHGSTEEIVRL
jgi:hypothetical protein